jgi:spermidine synthase
LLLPALAGLLILRSRATAAVLAVIALAVPAVTLAASGGIRPADRGTLLHEEESAYNYIQVVEENGAHELILNEGRAIHSIYNPDQLLTGGPWDYFMAAPLLVADSSDPAPQDALIIGLAGGTTARQLTAAFGPIPITGVEIDPSIVQVARDYFGLDDLANLSVDVEDGRYALRTSHDEFDLIGIDAYRQPYIPFQLTTREFFHEVQGHLRPGGVAVINAGRTQTDFRLVDALAATLRDVFPYVLAVDVGRYNNTMLIASDSPLTVSALSEHVKTLPADSPVREVSRWIEESGNAREIQPGGLVFTDDHAPVELVIDTMILDAAREITGGAP